MRHFHPVSVLISSLPKNHLNLFSIFFSVFQMVVFQEVSLPYIFIHLYTLNHEVSRCVDRCLQVLTLSSLGQNIFPNSCFQIFVTCVPLSSMRPLLASISNRWPYFCILLSWAMRRYMLILLLRIFHDRFRSHISQYVTYYYPTTWRCMLSVVDKASLTKPEYKESNS
jgi:hypothetical protein